MDLLLAGRHALVTGGSRGIGFGIVSELAAEGAHVTFCGRDADIGRQVQAELRAKNHQVTFLIGDVTSERGGERACRRSHPQRPRGDIGE